MKDTYVHANFPSGVISNRVVAALSALPIRKFAPLVENKLIKVPKGMEDTALQDLTYHYLRWNLLDEYADACDVTVGDFIYGSTKPANARYSSYDAEVIALLNALPPERVVTAANVIRAVYFNPKMRITKDSSPSIKIVSIALMGSRMPKDVALEELEKYSTNINQELARFRDARLKERFTFHIDYILDMCIYFQISPHWVFSLKSALLCNSQDADDFFDLFCLLTRPQQLSVLAMLLALCEDAETQLPQEILRDIECAIAEGGVV